MMQRFEYASPSSVESAVGLLGPDAVILAGGTDLLSLMKNRVVTPSRVVSIRKIADIRGISSTDSGGLRIGALTTVEELLGHRTVRESFPCLWQAGDGIRSPQIQSVGTVGGDLCQRPRCWYYRNGFGLLAMHDGNSMVVEGDNRYHAVLGNDGPAYFVNPSSFAPALIALGATLKIAGPSGERTTPASEFFRTPAGEGEKEYDLADNEILVDITVPKPAPASSTYEIREKEALDWPLTTASAVLEMSGETVQSAALVLGHVAPTPWRVEAAAASLAGKSVSEETAAAAARLAVQGARALSKNGYKIRLAEVAAKRAILRAAGMEVA
jgi:xanthine dehydrogenase YagS FAD-binding subunit